MKKYDLEYYLRTPITAAWYDVVDPDEMSNIIDLQESDLPKQQFYPEPAPKKKPKPAPQAVPKPVPQQQAVPQPKAAPQVTVKPKKPIELPKPEDQRIELPKPSELPELNIQKLIEQSPELQALNEFQPALFLGTSGPANTTDSEYRSPFNPFNESDPKHIDLSLNVCKLLKDYGYYSATWQLGPEYDVDNCDHGNWSENGKCWEITGAPYDFDYLIGNAQSFSINHPSSYPKPIIAISHPGCNCSLYAYSPQSPFAIPDSAPGLPSMGTPEQLALFKEDLWKNLNDITFDRFTTIEESKSSMKKKSSSVSNDRIAKWNRNIKPVRMNKNYLHHEGLGIIRPIPKTYTGFLIDESEDEFKIYLSGINRVIKVPYGYFEDISLKPVQSSEITKNSYIESNGVLGIALFQYPDNKLYAYFPSSDGTAIVSDWKLLEA